MKIVTIVDVFGFFFRSFYALPPLKSSKGEPTGLLTGFVNFISKLEREATCDYLIFCADSSGESFRNKLYSEYKANRKEAPEELKAQIPIALDWIKKMGFELVMRDGFEADDLIASLATKAESQNYQVRVASHDKDMYQLISDRVVVFDIPKQKSIDKNGCFEKFGVYPEDFIEFQALLGDTSDNIPGVKGVGQVTASKLINEYKTIENIYEKIESVEPERVKKLLNDSKEMAFLSKKLVTLDKNALDAVDFENYTIPDTPLLNIKDELEKYDIRAIFGTPRKREVEKKIAFEKHLISSDEELAKIVANIPAGSIVAFDTETDSLDKQNAKIVGFSFAFEESRAYYAPIAHSYLGVPDQIGLDSAKDTISKLFADHKIVGQNLKFDLHILEKNFALSNLNIYADTMVLAWMIDSSSRLSLDELAKKWLNYEMIDFKTAIKGAKHFGEIDLELACNYASEDALITLLLYPKLLNYLKLQDEALLEEFETIELPFLKVLQRIESNGIKLDVEAFAKLKIQIDSDLENLQKLIYDQAGEPFNINSPKQLAVVLFERLNLPAGKKTKTGYSTDESVLQKIKDAHPIVENLLGYREKAKLKSTYIDPLITIASNDPDRRIYTNFSQTGTTTGRLSSSEPNLQNIPARSEQGRKIRAGFIADSGKLLIGADYSQIELRLLAHFSEDKTLVKAFEDGRDIHLETARVIFGDDEAKAKRSLAKSVNFGLLYGMGSRKLAEDTGITQVEAKEVISHYFSSFPTVKSYLESIKDEAHKLGFVTTLLNRRRNFDFGTASPQFVAMYEREAVNTRFQGSAADLIKIAMIRLDQHFFGNDKIKMILQIHDELLFEVDEDFAEEAKAIIAEIMQSVYKLKVPLTVSINSAKSWAEL